MVQVARVETRYVLDPSARLGNRLQGGGGEPTRREQLGLDDEVARDTDRLAGHTERREVGGTRGRS